MQHQHQQFPSPPAAVAPAPSSYASYAPLPSGLATANAAAMRPQRKNAMTTPSIDRAIEGALQGGLTGGVWGSFVALQARAHRPEPHALRQVSRIAGGYTLAIGGLLGLFNGASSLSHQMRTDNVGVGRGWAPTAGSDHWIDSVVGGFVAGFVVSAPLSMSPPTAAAAAAAAASASAHAAEAHAMAASASYAGFGGLHSHAGPSALQSFVRTMDSSFNTAAVVQQLQRVQWRVCTHYGLALGALGALTHLIAALNDNKLTLTPMPRHTTGRSGPGAAGEEPRVGRSD